MSFSTVDIDLTLPVTEARVVLFNKAPDTPRVALLRHLNKAGQTGPATVKWQHSFDGVNWDDLPGTPQVVNAGAGTSWLIDSTRQFLALAAFGNVDVELFVGRSDPEAVSPPTFGL